MVLAGSGDWGCVQMAVGYVVSDLVPTPVLLKH
jgi:hypothetical protein